MDIINTIRLRYVPNWTCASKLWRPGFLAVYGQYINITKLSSAISPIEVCPTYLCSCQHFVHLLWTNSFLFSAKYIYLQHSVKSPFKYSTVLLKYISWLITYYIHENYKKTENICKRIMITMIHGWIKQA